MLGLVIYLFILYLKVMSAPIYLEKKYAGDGKRHDKHVPFANLNSSHYYELKNLATPLLFFKKT